MPNVEFHELFPERVNLFPVHLHAVSYDVVTSICYTTN